VKGRKPGARLAAVPASQRYHNADGPDRAARESARRTTRAAYTALGWVVLFFAFRVYWYLGGSFASPGKLPADHTRCSPGPSRYSSRAPSRWGVRVLAIARGWARGRLALAAAALVWAGCVLLLLRGGAGVIDDLTRATGLLPNGLTGLSTKDATGGNRNQRSVQCAAIAGLFLRLGMT